MTHGPEQVRQTETTIEITRTYDAPRELVWKAWTDPAQAGAWWGPAGFTTTTHEMDVRPGGTWRFVMHGPDGTDYPNVVHYDEVAEPSLLAYRHGDGKELSFTVTVRFDEDGPGRTRLTLRTEFPNAAQKDLVVREYGAIEGGRQTLGRLAEHLGAPAGIGEALFVTRRVVRATPQRTWRAWTSREELLQWFGPKGMPMTHCTLDLRPGGVMHYGLAIPGGSTMWGKWVFREIVPESRLVFVQSFSDEGGGTAVAPFFDGRWPLETLSVVTFEPHAGKGGGTVVTLRAEPLDRDEVRRRTFRDNHPSMQGGWSGTFDQLEELLARG
jgi:uncharacterized protein YndB with AHSA1/START domain